MRPKYQMGKRAGAEGASISLTAAPEEINYAHAALAGQTVRPDTPLRHGQCILKEKS